MKKRDYNLDLIKFIAIIATISIHVLSAGSRADLFSKTWIFFVVAGSLFRFCVPVFCMCAGYLLYTKEKIDFKSIYKKIFKFFVYFILAELMYRMISCYYVKFVFNDAVSFEAIKKDILEGNFKDHLYYIFIIIFIYAFAPVCNKFVKNEKGELKYLLGLWIFVSLTLVFIINLFNIKVLSIFRLYNLSGAYNYVLFALFGAYINKYKDKFLDKNFFYYFLGFFISYLLVVYLTISRSVEKFNSYIWDNPNILIFGSSFTLFLMCMKIKIKNNFIKKFLEVLSKNIFGIYIFHVIFTDYINIFKLEYINFDAWRKLFIIIIEIGLVFILSFALTFILKTIYEKILKKIFLKIER